MNDLLKRFGMRNVFFVLGAASAIAALAFASESYRHIPAAGAACGLAVAAGLCMVAAAIVEAAGPKERQKPPAVPEREDPE